jgi:hypothetical protein
MAEATFYSQILRPVGQMLESLGVESFALQLEGDEVLVKGQKKLAPSRPPAPEVSLKVVWQMLRGKQAEQSPAPRPTSGAVELRYNRDDISRTEAEGRNRRKAAGGGPEPHSLSQILRAVGAFVDEKSGRLLAVKKDGLEITFEYESTLGRNMSEKFSVASLYDYWVKMYLKRRGRPAP